MINKREDGHDGRPQLRPRLNRDRAIRLRTTLRSPVPYDEVAVLRRRNEDQAIVITKLQEAMREVRLEMDDLKRIHLKELMSYRRR